MIHFALTSTASEPGAKEAGSSAEMAAECIDWPIPASQNMANPARIGS